MGIESGGPRESDINQNEVANLAQTLQSESSSDAEKEAARTALIDLKNQHLQKMADISTTKLDAEGGPGTRDQVMARRKSFDDRKEQEMVAVREINIALGLSEEDTFIKP